MRIIVRLYKQAPAIHNSRRRVVVVVIVVGVYSNNGSECINVRVFQPTSDDNMYTGIRTQIH